jgi:hypothetical protein
VGIIQKKMTTNKIYFKTADTKEPTLIYDMAYPSSHKSYFIKSETNQVYREKTYSGKGIFGGKDYFVWVAELNYKRHKSKTFEELRELGKNLCDGTQKIFVNGKEKMIQWPAILADDEKPWTNQRPEMYVAAPVYPETEGKHVNCDCDICCMISDMV